MAVYITRDLYALHSLIKETIEGLWKNTSVSDITTIGLQKRILFTVDGKQATLDIYQNKDGYTTFKATGKNTEWSEKLITELEKKGYPTTSDFKSYSIYVGDEWIEKSVDYLKQLTTQSNLGQYSKKTNNGNIIHSFTSILGDRLTLTACHDGKVLVQGKPLYLYNEFLSLISHSPNVKMEAIIAATKEFVSENVSDVSAARNKMNTLMPNAYGSGIIDDTIWKVLSPSMALIDVVSTMEDYSFIMFPALRALEGYLEFLLLEIGETIDLHHKVGDIFRNDPANPNKFIMAKHSAITKANQKGAQYKPALEEVYSYFSKHRHVSFHMNQIFIDTKVIGNKQEAIDTVLEVCRIIEDTFSSTHP